MKRHLVPLLLAGAILWWGSTWNYLLFHAFAEFWSIVIACLIGVLGLMIPGRDRHPLTAGLGILYISVAIVDILHTLAFKGMGVFPGFSANPSTQFWILARSLESGGLLATILFYKSRRFVPAFSVGIVLASALGISTVFSGFFPDCYLPETGLTGFKVASEYGIALLLGIGAFLLFRSQDPSIQPYRKAIVAGLLLTIASEMAFTLYKDVYGLMNMTGHVFKVFSFYVLLVGVILKSMKDPLHTIYLPILEAQRTFLETLSGPSFLLDDKGYLVVSNLDRFVKPSSERIQIPDDIRSLLRQWRQEACQTGEPVRGNVSFGERDLSAVLEIFRNTEGKEEGLVFVSVDVTDELALRRKLEASESRYRRLVEDMPAMVSRYSPDFRLTFVNGEYCRYFQLTEQELLGQPFLSSVPEEEKEGILSHFLSFTKEAPVGTLEHAVHLPDGSIAWQRWIDRALFDEKGNRTGYQSIGFDITEKKKREEEIGRLSTIVQKSLNEIYLFDGSSLLFEYVNERALFNLGYSVEEFLKMGPLDIKPCFDETGFRAMLAPLLEERVPLLNFRTSHRRKDGSEYEISLTLQRLGSGEDKTVVAIGLDVTETVRMQREIEESANRYKALFRENVVPMWLLDPETGRFIEVNKSAVKKYGYSEAQFKEMTVFDINRMGKKDLQEAMSSVVRTSRERFQFQHHLANGEQRSVAVLSTSMELNGKRVIHSIIQDVTDQVLAQKALEEKTQTLDQLFGNSPLAIFACDSERRILNANAEAVRMFGFQTCELKGKTLEELVVSPEEYDEGVALGDRVYLEQRVMRFEAERVKKDGTRFPIFCIGFPLILSEQAVGSFVIYQDISEKRANENKINRINRELQDYVQELRSAWEQTIQVLAVASEAKDPYTAGHQRRVARLAREIGKEMGLDNEALHRVELAALVHDIGKIEIPSEILAKPSRLSPIERKLIETHSETGWRILKGISLPWPLAEITLQHHERVDGSGYPRGLKGEEIFLEAKIIAVADTVEAMASHRPYRPALGIEAALQEITRGSGNFYSGEVCDACLRVFEKLDSQEIFCDRDAFAASRQG